MRYLGNRSKESLTDTPTSMGWNGKKKQLRGLGNWNISMVEMKKSWIDHLGALVVSWSSPANSTRRHIWWESYSSLKDIEDKINWPPIPSHPPFWSFIGHYVTEAPREKGNGWWRLESWLVYQRDWVAIHKRQFSLKMTELPLIWPKIYLTDQKWGK